MVITFHCNTSLPHQREHGQWFTESLKRHGLTVEVTSDIHKQADIHIVSGPHYAKQVWQGHPRVLLLDRAYLPDHQVKTKWASEDWVSLGWMRKDGGRTFRADHGGGRSAPQIKDRSAERGTIFLADYAGPIEQADTIRRHPSEETPTEGLREVLRRHRTAIGYQTSALVMAALEGLEVVCKDKRNIMSEPNWLELLPYADWHYSEFDEAWEHLKYDIDISHTTTI